MPDHHLASVAEFLFKDVLFETWEARKADRKFHAANKWPKYSLMFSETYWMVKDGKRTKKVNIGLYLCKDELYKGKDDDDVEIILNKGLLESLLTTAKNGPGEPGLRHLHKGHFMWQLIEDVKNNFKPEELLNDSSSSSSSSTSPEPSSSSSGASPGPGPGPGPGPDLRRNEVTPGPALMLQTQRNPKSELRKLLDLEHKAPPDQAPTNPPDLPLILPPHLHPKPHRSTALNTTLAKRLTNI